MPGIRFLQCHKCKKREVTFRSLFRHLHAEHGHERNWLCGLQGCLKTYVTYGAYRKHVSRYHAKILEENNIQYNTEGSEESEHGVASTRREQLNSLPVIPFSANADISRDMETSVPDSPRDGPDLFKQFSLLQLKWKEGKRLPSSTLQDISTDVVLYLQSMFELSLSPSQLVRNNVKSFVECKLEKPLNEHEREMYWKFCLPFVEPESICIGRDSRGKKETFSYISVTKVLENSLQNVSGNVGSSHSPRSDEYLVDVFDGTAFQDHAYFRGDNRQLCIQLYTDEFEVCDALASRRGKQKLMAVYYTVLNAPFDSRSKLSSIHLAVLAKEKLVAKYGLKRILEPLVNDVALLETVGVTVNGELLKGSVFFVTGDNLSLHRLGGFRCSFSHGRICRHCMALHHEIGTKHRPSDFQERTPSLHNHYLSLLSRGVSCLPLYGVRSECAVTFSGFEPTQHLPPDVMHDLHEGVIPLLLKEVISFFVKDGTFTLELLNTAIVTYKYSEDDKRNKPEPVSTSMLQKKGTIKGSASQLYCLFRYLPFYVGECIPRGQKVWELYLLFRKVVDIIMSKRVTVEYIAYLERLITCFSVDFKDVFPAVRVPCKLHFLIHYPRYMLMYGPLVRIWSMRYEGKHQYFKDLARKLRNFKNIVSTLANRHQAYEMYLQCCETGDMNMTTRGCKPLLYEHLPFVVKNFICANAMSTETIFSLVSADIGGTAHAVGSVKVIDLSSDQPNFVMVTGIFSVSRHLLLQVEKLKTIEFDEHYHANVIRKTSETSILTDVSSHQTDALAIHVLGTRILVSVRHALI
ncbi:uncharacterized protein LOC115314770 [Ixodes scapularis]|uniref:uncharacterized protein LOC115314770 n=1 Tax=Ixodes scapularis TaxID=6945 RepID=UPI001AD61DA4|nr:uncharacterized protein LOC115314770 [Ixodes scapularis]